METKHILLSNSILCRRDVQKIPENIKNRDQLEDLCKHGRVKIKWALPEGSVDRTHLAYDRVQLKDIVNTIMHINVPYRTDNFLAVGQCSLRYAVM